MPKVTIYSTPTCHFCHMAKEFFQKNNIPFVDYDVKTDLERRKEMVQKSGQLGVPVIDIDGQIIVGFYKEKVAQALGVPAA